jgi:hypothetical protein
MKYGSLTLCALASAAMLAACGDEVDDITLPTTTNATVRFVNATNTSTTVANNGAVATGNSTLGFGSGSSCMTVKAASPNLTFTNSGTNSGITGFTPNFQANGNYTVVAYTGANGTTQFATLDNTYTPTAGQAGLRVFNAASGSGNVVLLGNGTALNSGTATTFGNSGSFFSVPAGSQTLTFNTGTGTSTIANLGSVSFTAGQNTTVVLGPASTGTAPLRAFTTSGC